MLLECRKTVKIFVNTSILQYYCQSKGYWQYYWTWASLSLCRTVGTYRLAVFTMLIFTQIRTSTPNFCGSLRSPERVNGWGSGGYAPPPKKFLGPCLLSADRFFMLQVIENLWCPTLGSLNLTNGELSITDTVEPLILPPSPSTLWKGPFLCKICHIRTLNGLKCPSWIQNNRQWFTWENVAKREIDVRYSCLIGTGTGMKWSKLKSGMHDQFWNLERDEFYYLPTAIPSSHATPTGLFIIVSRRNTPTWFDAKMSIHGGRSHMRTIAEE